MSSARSTSLWRSGARRGGCRTRSPTRSSPRRARRASSRRCRPAQLGQWRVYPESSSPFAGEPVADRLPQRRAPLPLLFFKLTPSDIFHHGLFVGGVGIGRSSSGGARCAASASSSRRACRRHRLCARARAIRPRNSVCAHASEAPLLSRRRAMPRSSSREVEKMTQRRVCASLNQWCRGPGLVISSFLIYSAVMSGRGTFPRPLASGRRRS